MKCPMRVDSEGAAWSCLKEECAWWVGSTNMCAILEIAANGIYVYLEEEAEGDKEDGEG